MKKRSHRVEKMARVYDDEILPIWSQRFGRLLLRGLQVPPKPMVLDYGCGTGFPTLELMKRMSGEGRIIAIDPAGPLLDVARKKAGALSGKRIFFRSEPPTGKLAFADDVYDLVVSNVALHMVDDPKLGVSELVRVAKAGGQIIITLPLAGTFRELFDIYREVLTKSDKHAALERLEAHIAEMPEAETVAAWFETAGVPKVEVEVEEFSLLFKSSREFFFAPVIEFGPLSSWKEIAGKGQEMQEVFWHIKEAIDAYFGDRGFGITVIAGCFRARKPMERVAEDTDMARAARDMRFGDEEAPLDEDDETPLEDDFRLEEDTNA